jgi:hypothetical protein
MINEGHVIRDRLKGRDCSNAPKVLLDSRIRARRVKVFWTAPLRVNNSVLAVLALMNSSGYVTPLFTQKSLCPGRQDRDQFFLVFRFNVKDVDQGHHVVLRLNFNALHLFFLDAARLTGQDPTTFCS